MNRTITIWHNPACGTSRNILAFIRSLGIAAWLVCTTASAAPQVGDYASMGVGGWLKVSPGAGQSLKFRIDVLGGNASMCGLEGVIQGSQARVEAFGQSCVIDFKDIPDGLDVSDTTTPGISRGAGGCWRRC
jgi:hypothetical protein